MNSAVGVLEDVEWLTRLGETADRIVVRCRFRSWATLERLLYRNHREDLIEQIKWNSHARGLTVRGQPLTFDYLRH